jgi:phage terminase Nu1 subunit (DNA packaging protein)
MTQPDPPPFDQNIGMFQAKLLGIWINQKLPLRRGKGGSYPYLPDLSALPLAPRAAPISGEAVDRVLAEARLATAKANMAEMDEAVMRGKLIQMDQVESALMLMVSRVKTRLLGIPTSLAPVVTGLTNPVEVQQRLNDRIREALEHLSVDGWFAHEDDTDAGQE